MAQRRERPSIGRSGDSLNVRLPDGRTLSVPVNEPRGPVTSDRCCFCGESVEDSGREHIRVEVRWDEAGTGRRQSWSAHRTCLLERMHEGVKGEGPFFGDD